MPVMNDYARPRSRFARVLDRYFPTYQILVRTGGDIRHVRITKLPQMALFAAALMLVGWGSFTTAMVLLHQDIMDHKTRQVAEAREAFRSLAREVAVYRERIDHAAQGLAETYERQLTASADDGDTEAVTRERQWLLARMEDLHKGLDSMTMRDDWLRIDRESTLIDLRRTRLADNLEAQENDRLRMHVADLESLLDTMRGAQREALVRMGGLAKNGVDEIKQVLARTGVDLAVLLDRQDAAREGQGGPYIPADVADLRDDGLNELLGSLHQQMDYWENLDSLFTALPFGPPVERLRITSRFGVRKDPLNGRRAMHEGLDMGGPRGTKIFATAPGTVIYAGRRGNYGLAVEIDHGLGFTTRFGHMRKILVEKGERVDTGDIVGHLGNTGRSTGPHLHYEVRFDGRPLNPLGMVKVRKHVSKNH